MDKIVEEVLTGMIKRIEVLENKISKISIPNKKGYHPSIPPQSDRKPGMISQGQIDFIEGLERDVGCEGESQYAEMTMKQASVYIEDLKERKTQGLIKKEGQMAQKMVEKFGDRDIHDLGKESKPLSKKEIKKLEEEGALL